MAVAQLKLFSPEGPGRRDFVDDLISFNEYGRATETFADSGLRYFVNEYWTSRQRQSHNLHEISYRACFKAELPRFLIERLTQPGDLVYDPFMGRGTTLLEAALLGRRAAGNYQPFKRHADPSASGTAAASRHSAPLERD